MRRRWKALIGILVALAALLVVNAVVTDNQTKPAAVTIDGGRILHLTGGDLQVLEQGPKRAQPIVLLHCYACSMHWWDRLAPILARDHRVIRIDLLGFGGSEKPSGGYTIENQAALVAEALARLDAQGAVVVGHSMGFDVTTALATNHSELVDRAVDIDEAPDPSFGSLPFTVRLQDVPLLGQALWRAAPSFVVKREYGSAFAPGYDLADGFDDPNQVVDDFRDTTFTSFHEMRQAEHDYASAEPLDARIRSAAVPLLVIFGTEDQLWDDPAAAANAYHSVPGAQVAMIPGAGHSPNVEQPDRTARLIDRFAAQAHYSPPPARGHRRRGGGRRSTPKEQQDQRNRNHRQHRHGADGARKHHQHGG